MEVVGGEPKDLAGFGGDARGVGVGVVQSGQGGRDAAGEAWGEGGGDGVDGVGCR